MERQSLAGNLEICSPEALTQNKTLFLPPQAAPKILALVPLPSVWQHTHTAALLQAACRTVSVAYTAVCTCLTCTSFTEHKPAEMPAGRHFINLHQAMLPASFDSLIEPDEWFTASFSSPLPSSSSPQGVELDPEQPHKLAVGLH